MYSRPKVAVVIIVALSPTIHSNGCWEEPEAKIVVEFTFFHTLNPVVNESFYSNFKEVTPS